MTNATTTTKPLKQLEGDLGQAWSDAFQLYRNGPVSLAAGQPAGRMSRFRSAMGIGAGRAPADAWAQQYGLDWDQVAGAVRSGGAVPFAPAEMQAQQRALAFANGDYVDNPYVDRLYESASKPVIEDWQTQIMPTLTGQFEGSGNYGSGAHEFFAQQSAGRLADTLGDLRLAAVEPARRMELQDIGLMSDVGSRQSGATSSLLAASQGHAMAPWDQLNQYFGTLSNSGAGSYGRTTSPTYQNTAAGTLGMGILGAMAGKEFGPSIGAAFGASNPESWGNWGTAIGGAGSALMRLL